MLEWFFINIAKNDFVKIATFRLLGTVMAVANWKRGVGILTGVYVSRMLGMFMVFPVFSLYAQGLQGGNAFLAGIALGAYGLTQGLLQIPFGYFSDRFGRKRMILIGLFLFLIGTVIAALAANIWTMIFGRAVQGMGAISAVALAYASDIAPTEKRGIVMAIIGGSIGMAFVFALILGPLITGWVGSVSGLFWVIAAMVIIALFSATRLPVVDKPEVAGENYERKKLWQACFAVAMLHATFTGAFTVLPSILVNEVHLDKLHHWWIYLPANIIALAFMRYKAYPHPLNFGVNFVIMALAYGMLVAGSNIWWLVIAVTIFFIGFYRLETGLPHWVSQFAEPNSRGRAMGVFSTCQFLGSFIGAALCGLLMNKTNAIAVLIALLCTCAITALILLNWGKHDKLTTGF